MKKFFKTLLVALLLIPSCAWANGWNDAEYQRIEQSIQLPGIKQAAKKYAISAYGAKQNASAAQNQKAINKLIALVSKKGGGTVVIPKGTWRTGAIEMKSFVELNLEEGPYCSLPSNRNSIRWYAPHGRASHAGTILHASMPTRLPTSPSLVKVPSMEVVTTIHGGQ